jgi:hypothetical protein
MFFFKKHLLLYISNILEKAGNSLGYKHSFEIISKMSKIQIFVYSLDHQLLYTFPSIKAAASQSDS